MGHDGELRKEAKEGQTVSEVSHANYMTILRSTWSEVMADAEWMKGKGSSYFMEEVEKRCKALAAGKGKLVKGKFIYTRRAK